MRLNINKLNNFVVLTLFLSFISQGCSMAKTAPNIRKEGGSGENVPMVSEFILGAGDRLDIVVHRNDDLRRTVQVDNSGKIMYPLVGDIHAAGLGLFQLRDEISKGLSKYLVNPQISISIISVQSQKIIVLGEVNNPGFFQAETAMTALEAISRAGGFTGNGKAKSVLVIRGGLDHPQLIKLNLEKVLTGKSTAQNIVLQRSDIVYVPRTLIANVESFFAHLSNMISPIVAMETGYFIGQQIDGTRGAASTTP